MKTHQTLGEFIIQNQKDFQHSTGEFSRLLSAIKLASKLVNREVNMTVSARGWPYRGE